MTSVQEKTYKLLTTPLATGITIVGLITFTVLRWTHSFCAFFVLFTLALYLLVHFTITKANPYNKINHVMATVYSAACLIFVGYIAIVDDKQSISIASVLSLAVMAIAGLCAFIGTAIGAVTGKTNDTKTATENIKGTHGFDYIPEKERYIKDRKKRRRQRAADKVRSLGLFGNETIAITYGALTVILLMAAILKDLLVF